MGKIIKLILVLIIISTNLISQDITYDSIERSTYKLYKQEKWNELIEKGNLGLKSGIDYYYLRMRLGIAYLEKSNFRMAAGEFENALRFNNNDKIAWQYFGSALKNSNQNNRFLSLSSEVPKNLLPSLYPERRRILEMIYFESGISLTDNFDENAFNNLMGQNDIYGYQNMYGNNFYAHLGTQWRLNNSLSAYVGYSYMNIEKRQRFQYTTYDAVVDSVVHESWGYSKYYSFPLKEHNKQYDYSITQNELYANLTYTASNGIQIIPAFHWIHVSSSPMSSFYSTESTSDTAYYLNASDTAYMFSYESPVYSFAEEDLTSSDYAVSLYLSKPFNYFDLGIETAVVGLNKLNFLEAKMSLTYYPLGNLNLYFLAQIRGSYTANKLSYDEDNEKIIYHGLAGIRATKWLWIEALGTFGNLSGTTESNAFVVYNNTDNIKYRFGSNLILLLGKRIELSLRFQHISKEGRYINYLSSDVNDIRSIKYNYFSNNFYGGIKWKL